MLELYAISFGSPWNFLRNGFPLKFIDKCVNKFLEKIFIKEPIKHTVPKKDFFLVLPYLGDLSGIIQKRITNAFDKAIPWGKINITFKTHSRISHLFRFKDPVPNDIVSKVIYYYTCPSCNTRYVGETERHCKVR